MVLGEMKWGQKKIGDFFSAVRSACEWLSKQTFGTGFCCGTTLLSHAITIINMSNIRSQSASFVAIPPVKFGVQSCLLNVLRFSLRDGPEPGGNEADWLRMLLVFIIVMA